MMGRTKRHGYFVCAFAVALAFAVWADSAEVFGASVTFYPAKDGTLLDGGGTGPDAPPFDGQADDADWIFNRSSYEGTITLAVEGKADDMEHRVVWEYNLLGSVTFVPPVTARLKFVLRGAPAYPRPDVDVHIYSYPADLFEELSDFSVGPAVLQGSVTLAPYQQPTQFNLPVSDAVNEVLLTGVNKVGFRFQVDPHAVHALNQAFLDAMDSDRTTKPALVINDAIPGDADLNDTVDMADYGRFADCMNGPGVPFVTGCPVLDLDLDADVDLRDLAVFQRYFGATK